MARRRLSTERAARAAAAAILALLVPEAASAEDSTRSRPYVGAGLAVADFESDHGGIAYGATPLGWQLYGGLQTRDRVGVELALDHLADIEPGVLLGSGVERLRISAEH